MESMRIPDTYIKLCDAAKKYKIPPKQLAAIARSWEFNSMYKKATFNTNKLGKKDKFVFHMPTLERFLISYE